MNRIRTAPRLPRSGHAALAAGALIQAALGAVFLLAGLGKVVAPDYPQQFRDFVQGSAGANAGGARGGGRATRWTRRRWPASCSPTPTCPHAFKTAAADLPDPAREALAVLVRARHQVVDRHRRLLNEAEALLTELPAALAERLPGRKQTPPRLAAGAAAAAPATG